MDKAMVLNGAKRYKESNAFLEQAKIAAQELWTESIGENIGALLTTDNNLPIPEKTLSGYLFIL